MTKFSERPEPAFALRPSPNAASWTLDVHVPAGWSLYAAKPGSLGLPLTAVGLFYHHGYFTQEVDTRGAQDARFPRYRSLRSRSAPQNDSSPMSRRSMWKIIEHLP